MQIRKNFGEKQNEMVYDRSKTQRPKRIPEDILTIFD